MWNLTVDFYPHVPTQMDAVVDFSLQVLLTVLIWVPTLTLSGLFLAGAYIVIDAVVSKIRGKK